MNHRLVHLHMCATNSIASSSIFNIGDTVHFNPRFKAIAVQRESNVWNETYSHDFEDYSIFKRDANWIEISIPVETYYKHHDGDIKVKNVSITGVSQASTVQFGGIKKINAESRIKHIRILQDEENRTHH
ncbi:spore germination protein GerPE [Paucisalibacillus sp. EB02]|uniref:spore germination protein GerPE n=1 Tax=Paucisalibacillus sp. EB02 TaxID=1347087 RepID=UPI0006949EDF|nr:spore germination protein GerPE [Paucisalibacillus sp. EB02]